MAEPVTTRAVKLTFSFANNTTRAITFNGVSSSVTTGTVKSKVAAINALPADSAFKKVFVADDIGYDGGDGALTEISDVKFITTTEEVLYSAS